MGSGESCAVIPGTHTALCQLSECYDNYLRGLAPESNAALDLRGVPYPSALQHHFPQEASWRAVPTLVGVFPKISSGHGTVPVHSET